MIVDFQVISGAGRGGMAKIRVGRNWVGGDRGERPVPRQLLRGQAAAIPAPLD